MLEEANRRIAHRTIQMAMTHGQPTGLSQLPPAPPAPEQRMERAAKPT